MCDEVAVSVVIPVYNSEKYLDSCIRSAIRQTLKNIEIIVINDGSTDNSCEILKKYQQLDGRVQIISQKNHGLSYSRNVGIRKSRGEYLFFLDSDDTLEEKSLQMLYQKAKISDSLMTIGRYKKTYFDSNAINIYKTTLTDDTVKDVLVGNIQVPVCNKLYHKKFFVENDLNFANKLYHEDNLFTLKAVKFAKNQISILDEVVYNYQYRKGSISSSFGKKHVDDMIKIFDLSYEFLREHDMYKDKKIYFLVFVFDLVLYYLQKYSPNETNSLLFETFFKKLKKKKYISKALLEKYKKYYPIPFFLFTSCTFVHKIKIWNKMLLVNQKEDKNFSQFNPYQKNYHILFVPYLEKNCIKSIIAYGANDICRDLEPYLIQANIKILNIIDKKAENENFYINSKKVLTLQQCLSNYNEENIVILSLNHAKEIRQDIKKFMIENQKKFNIIDIYKILQR